MKLLGMIPARMGSQRLRKKNLRELDGVTLIERAIRKCKVVKAFDEIWVNSENSVFGSIAKEEGVFFHQRPDELGGHNATSEEYIAEFLEKHECDLLFQIHSIAPLLTAEEISGFVDEMLHLRVDVLLGYEPIQIECVYQDKPVNFSMTEKINSQNLQPVRRITWSITGWRREKYLDAVRQGQCATYAGKIGFFELSSFAAHVIKTETDLNIAKRLLPLVKGTL